jgi:hypothetical protein
MRRVVPVIALSLMVAAVPACRGDGGGSTKAFCDEVKELRKLGREPGSTEPADAKLLAAQITGLRDLERSAPLDVKSDIATIRDTLETIADVGEGKPVDPKRIEQLSDSEKIRKAGENIDRHVKRCGIEVGST